MNTKQKKARARHLRDLPAALELRRIEEQRAREARNRAREAAEAEERHRIETEKRLRDLPQSVSDAW